MIPRLFFYSIGGRQVLCAGKRKCIFEIVSRGLQRWPLSLLLQKNNRYRAMLYETSYLKHDFR